jgi:hypothetical protein
MWASARRLSALAPCLALVALSTCDSTQAVRPGPLAAGVWGGDGAGLIADDSSAHVHIRCTYGNVHQEIVADREGRFDVPGEYNIRAYPVDAGIFHPAQFSGTIQESTMTLLVTLTDTAVTLGPVTLTYGKQPVMGPCPICRKIPARPARFSPRVVD